MDLRLVDKALPQSDSITRCELNSVLVMANYMK